MTVIYLDTSVVVPLFVREPRSRDLADWLAGEQGPFAASAWLQVEAASAFARKQRSEGLAAATAERQWRLLLRFLDEGLRVLSVDAGVLATAATLAGTPTNGLRAGDAVHLASALLAGVDHFVTADRVLAGAARVQGLSVQVF